MRVLSLTAPYTLAEIQKYAQTPPEQVLLLPPPDTEAPDDLFPDEILNSRKVAGDTPTTDQELLQLWGKAKSKIWQLGIPDSQIANWFQRNYRLDVRLSDFDLVTPPAKLTAEHLTRFCDAIERYAARI